MRKRDTGDREGGSVVASYKTDPIISEDGMRSSWWRGQNLQGKGS
jgi:hypothetical protein